MRSIAALPHRLFPVGSPFQGAEVSASPYGPTRRVVEWSVWLFPVGSLFLGTEMSVQQNSEGWQDLRTVISKEALWVTML